MKAPDTVSARDLLLALETRRLCSCQCNDCVVLREALMQKLSRQLIKERQELCKAEIINYDPTI